MTFPDHPFSDAGSFADAYFERLATAAASVDRATLAKAAAILEAAYREGATVYVCGNGGYRQHLRLRPQQAGTDRYAVDRTRRQPQRQRADDDGDRQRRGVR